MKHPASRRDFLALSAAATAALGFGVPALAQTRTLRFGSPQPAESLYNQAIVKFADEVKALSSGAMEVEIFPASQLGGVREMLTSVQSGSLALTIAVPAWYSNFIKPMDVFTLPYLTASPERLRAGLEGAVGEQVSALASEAGFQFIGYWLMGARHIVNNVRPVTAPADVEGLKVRVINSQVYIEAFRALGANPVALDPSELYLALQQGVVDGFEYPLPDLIDAKLFEVAKYLSLDAHVTDFFTVSINQALWDGMSAEEQGIIDQAMQTSMDWQWAEQPKAIEQALATLRGTMTVNDISPEQRQAFIDATRPIYQQFADAIGPDLLQTAVKELGPA